MAISSVLFVPDKGVDKILNNLLPVLNNVKNSESDAVINKLVLTSDIDTIKSFYFLNIYMETGLTLDRCGIYGQRTKIYNYINKIQIATNKLLNISLGLSGISAKESFPKIVDALETLNVGVDTPYPWIHFYKKLIEYCINLNFIFKEVYTIPKGNTTLLIVVVDQDKYLSLLTSLVIVIKNIKKDTLISNYYLLEFVHKILSMYFKDILKQEIVKQPDVGVVVIDNKYANLNKSYLYSVL